MLILTTEVSSTADLLAVPHYMYIVFNILMKIRDFRNPKAYIGSIYIMWYGPSQELYSCGIYIPISVITRRGDI